MNFEPQKFFIGRMDFFSILLPGALLADLLMGEVGPAMLRDSYDPLAGAEAWAAFLLESYFFAHLALACTAPGWTQSASWAGRYTSQHLNCTARPPRPPVRRSGWRQEPSATSR
ncbi:hypothetical protein [Thiocapsa sp.]|uniref:hypothetical protein n=1 Tax=Thiocapsa sp. TaxID=2024551 RepID=UPI00359337F9